MKQEYLKLQRGFTLFELIVVISLMALIAGMVLPFTSNSIDKNKERKKIFEILSNINNLKNKSFSLLKSGEIISKDKNLIFILDSKEINKIETSQDVELENKIHFNKNGICSGGKFTIYLDRAYRFSVSKINGTIKVVKI